MKINHEKYADSFIVTADGGDGAARIKFFLKGEEVSHFIVTPGSEFKLSLGNAIKIYNLVGFSGDSK